MFSEALRMARYFFHIRGGREVIDEEGSELPDDVSARAAAVQSARDLLAGDVKVGRFPIDERIDVETEDRGLIISVTFREAVGLA